MTGSRLFMVGTVVAVVSALFMGLAAVQNILFRAEIRDILRSAPALAAEVPGMAEAQKVDQQILSLRERLTAINVELGQVTASRAALVRPDRVAAAEESIDEARRILLELQELIARSQGLQGEATQTLMQLTDAYARKIGALEEKAQSGSDLGLVASVTPLVGLIGALSVMLLGWRKDLREAAADRRRAD